MSLLVSGDECKEQEKVLYPLTIEMEVATEGRTELVKGSSVRARKV